MHTTGFHTPHTLKGDVFPWFSFIISLSVCSVSLSGAVRDLSARETVVLSKLKVTEEPSLCARFPGKKRIKLLFYLHIFQNSWGHFFPPSIGLKNVCFWNWSKVKKTNKKQTKNCTFDWNWSRSLSPRCFSINIYIS